MKATHKDALNKQNKKFHIETYPEIVDEIGKRIQQEAIEMYQSDNRLKIQEQINKMRLIIDNIQVGIMLVDAETRQILEINPQALKMVDACREKIIGNICHKFLCPAERNCCPVLDLGQVVDNAERILITQSGNILAILKTVVPIDMGGRKVLLESFMDLTEQRQIKMELQAAREAAEASNRIKSSFLANMSHEIRTPMNPIIGMAELLLQTELTTEQRDMVTSIQEAGQSLVTIINDVLDFSKIEAGLMNVEKVQFDPNSLIESAVDIVMPRARERGNHLKMYIDRSMPAIGYGDPVRIKQVLLNILTNAIKFTENGQIVVRAVPEQKHDGGIWLLVEVQDTGIGIAKEKQAQLFNPFVQADSSTTRKFGGTGLGLSICMQLIKLMEGNIGFHSESGQGSTFWFKLPLSPATGVCEPSNKRDELSECIQTNGDTSMSLDIVNEEGGTAVHNAKKIPMGTRVLLAEDNAANQKLAQMVLQKLGCIVSIAENGNEAVTMSERNEYDIILIDCQMPVMDGFEATRLIRLREQQEGLKKRIPIIALTANALHGDKGKCLKAGMDDYISKPINVEKLTKAISSNLIK